MQYVMPLRSAVKLVAKCQSGKYAFPPILLIFALQMQTMAHAQAGQMQLEHEQAP